MDKIFKYFGIGLAILGVVAVALIAVYAATGGFRSQQTREDSQVEPTSPSVPGSGFARPYPGGPMGEVTAINVDVLTLLTLNNRTLRINLSDQTFIRLVESQRTGNLSDIQIGDKVRVNGRPNDDGSFQAQAILVLPEGADLRAFPPGPQGNPNLPGGQNRPGPQSSPRGPIEVGGEVIVLDTESLILRTDNDREWEVRINKQTGVRLVEGDQLGDLGDIQIGDQVRVQGLPKGPGVIETNLILVLPHGDHRAGRVSAVNNAMITLVTPQGEVTVVISDATQFQSAPGQGGKPDLSKIEKGMSLIVYGELQTDGSLIARLVIIRRQEGSGGFGPGPRSPVLNPSPTP